LWKDGLNWFFKEGRRHCATLTATGLPTIGQADTGSQPWERRMIERLRLQHYAWRTEKTYREWAWRLADFMRPRDVEGATGEDVRQMQHETNYTNSHEEEAEGKQASPQKATKFTKSWQSGKKTTKERILTADYADYAENGRGWQGFKRGGEETGHRHKRQQSSQSPGRAGRKPRKSGFLPRITRITRKTGVDGRASNEAEGKQASPQKATKFTKSWPSGKKTTNSDKSRTGLSLMLATADTARNELHEFTRRGGGGGEETGHRHKRPQSSQSPRRWRKGNRHRHKRQQSSKSPVIYRFSQLFTSPGTTRNNGWGFGIETFRNRSATCGARR
jgi:hypothetical protein